jgi:hippurate hydrolase
MQRLIFIALGFIMTTSIALGFIMTTSTVLAQEKQVEQKATIPEPLVKEVEMIIDEDTDRLVEIFKGIHQDPELGFMEVNTAKIVSNELKSLGYDVITGIAKTGVVAILKNGDGPVVMYRADMDALVLRPGSFERFYGN